MTDSVPDVLVPPPEPLPEVVTQLLMFGTSLENGRRRKGSRRPNEGAGSNQCPTVGLRVSASMISTFAPSSTANVRARFIAIVDFPSPGSALVTRSTCGEPFASW